MVYPHDAAEEAELEDRGYHVPEDELAPANDAPDDTYLDTDEE